MTICEALNALEQADLHVVFPEVLELGDCDTGKPGKLEFIDDQWHFIPNAEYFQ